MAEKEKMDFANEFASTAGEFDDFKKKMKDPVVVGTMLYRLSEERESSNLVLKEINAKLDRLLALETRLGALEQKASAFSAATPIEATAGAVEVLLPEIDEDIMSFVTRRGKACAEEVQAKFHYKGRNAASSRLNRLCDAGVLEKVQVGRKVFFVPKSQSHTSR